MDDPHNKTQLQTIRNRIFFINNMEHETWATWNFKEFIENAHWLCRVKTFELSAVRACSVLRHCLVSLVSFQRQLLNFTNKIYNQDHNNWKKKSFTMRIAFVFVWPVLTFLRCTGVYYTFGFPGLCLLWRQDFVVSWFCSTHFCVLARLKNIFFISDFVMLGWLH